MGPISRCLRFTNRSLFLTRVPILMMSHAMSSCNIRTAWKQKNSMNREAKQPNNQKTASLSQTFPRQKEQPTLQQHGGTVTDSSQQTTTLHDSSVLYVSTVIFTCSNGTLRASSLIRSLALTMAYGSKVFLVVQTVMLPSIRSREALMC